MTGRLERHDGRKKHLLSAIQALAPEVTLEEVKAIPYEWLTTLYPEAYQHMVLKSSTYSL